jgi:hypothetical protein
MIYKKTFIFFSLALVMGAGFFVAPITMAVEESGHWQVNGYLYDIYLNDDTVFVGAEEIGVIGPDGSIRKHQLNLETRGDCQGLTTGSCLPGVRSIVSSNDNNTIYFSGNFTHVNGEPRMNLAAIDATTGGLKLWNPGVGNDRFDYARLLKDKKSDALYYFDYSQDPGQQIIYKIDSSTGAVMSWQPDWFGKQFNSLNIHDKTISPDGRYLYLNVIYTEAPLIRVYKKAIFKIDTTSGITTILNDFDGVAYYTPKMVLSPDGITMYLTYSVRNYESSYPSSYKYFLRKINTLSGASSDIQLTLNTDILELVINDSGTRLFARVGNCTHGWAEIREINLNDGSYRFFSYGDGSLLDFEMIFDFAISADNQYMYIAGNLEDNYNGTSMCRMGTIGDIVKVPIDPLPSSWYEQPSRTYHILPPDPLSGHLIKVPEESTVYYLSNNYIWPFTNEEVFNAWGFHWEDIKVVESLSGYATPATAPHMGYPWSTGYLPNGTLVKGSSSSVYMVIDNQLRPIKNEQIFNGLALRWDRIITLPDSTINYMAKGEVIDELNHPDGVVIQYEGSPAVYLVADGQKHVFVDQDAFLGRLYNWGQLLKVRPDITYPDGEPLR